MPNSLNADDDLKAATAKVRKLEDALVRAKAERDALIAGHAGSISRRRAAELTGLTPGRIQQIIDERSGR